MTHVAYWSINNGTSRFQGSHMTGTPGRLHVCATETVNISLDSVEHLEDSKEQHDTTVRH